MFGSKPAERKRSDDAYENLDDSPLATMLREERSARRRGAGGTSGGVLEFFLGTGMAAAGGYMILQQVNVTSGYWNFFGQHTFGLTLLPLLFGIGLLFFNGRSIPGWILSFVGAVIILAGIIINLDIYFRTTSLFNTLAMFVLLAGGLGLVARAVREK